MMEYKDTKSSVYSHIGNIPIHWDETRLKLRYKEVDNRSITGEEEMLSVSHITGITPRSQKNVTMFMAESNMGLKLIQPSDVVVNTMWAWMAAMGVSVYSGIVSPSYGVYRPIDVETYNPKYLNLLLRIENYRAEYVKHSTGIRASRLRLYSDKFLGLKFIRPPRDEQDQIVRYLDWKVSQINKLINAKRRQIELLGEQKRVVVNEAVTKGGEQRRLKTLVKDISEKGSPKDNYYIGMENIMSWTSAYVYTGLSADGDSKTFTKGDVLFGKLRPYLAKVYVPDRDGVCSGEFLVLRCFEGYIPFLKYFLLSYDFIMLVNASTYGAKMPRACWDFIGNCVIHVPPLKEQQVIATRLDQQCARIEKIISKLNEEISLLAEYRTRLISDVVTGELDVRGVAVPEFEIVEDAVGDAEIEDAEDSELTEE